ncbi:uncharacterized protein L969DRAFT_96911 [Mixia osmundae IAM 14324]|uniref:Haloacid dehalogenase, type II n=1 Tax=Mixia osmundae (strain CBS 9802 / IAM 14324 / JCM 22182 / KY 12970) TaxID=764103 RepID=G7E2G4_MIXOS|nr:uncharacterized protein L969DRAFT_96911 [Mixia osmundae IAM 14324]KEI36894.1 hypothetical protein L969DRAFT_96911 [Mixia osmundae IAM 14324]GAA97024.1 hypothetical protein E5Q_03699 [Mixia osmundae IAM 14324]
MRGCVVFDVFGTCFGFDNVIDEIHKSYAQDLERADTNAQAVFLSWFYQTQRDFTYLSLSDTYTPIAQVFAAVLPRVLRQAMPHLSKIDESRPKLITDQLKSLQPRPGLLESIKNLEEAGLDVYAFTNGAAASTKALFSQAYAQSSGMDTAFLSHLEARIISCDQVKAAKPDRKAYDLAKERTITDNVEHAWFVAAHQWDLLPARNVGYKTAWVSYEELEPVTSLFGEPDVSADSLNDLSDKIIASTR